MVEQVVSVTYTKVWYSHDICIGVFPFVSEKVGEKFGAPADHFVGQLIMSVVSTWQQSESVNMSISAWALSSVMLS